MRDFVAVDFETANPRRVSACALGVVRVVDGRIRVSKSFLIRPVGGHSEFQTKIHGISEAHTCDKPNFNELFPEVEQYLCGSIVAHSQFDKQVLKALSEHFNLDIPFEYTDSSSIARDRLHSLKNYKLKTLAKHFGLPPFKHHDACEDAIACAKIYLNLLSCAGEAAAACIPNDLSGRITEPVTFDRLSTSPNDTDSAGGSGDCATASGSHFDAELRGLVKGILADDVVNYREALELMYWLEDHHDLLAANISLYQKLEEAVSDGILDLCEAGELKSMLEAVG